MSQRKLTKAQKEDIAAKQNFKCAASISDYQCPLWERQDNKGIFGEEKYHVDHIVELWEGGKDDASNLQALCLNCHAVKTKRNTAKRNKLKREEKKNIPKKYDLQKIFNEMDYIVSVFTPQPWVHSNAPPRQFYWEPKEKAGQ